jgi:alpha-beta hydrolase superfamily lysophospholipase
MTSSTLIQASGTTFGVDLRGPAGAPAILVIHGAGEDADMLAPFAERLAETGRRVVTYDRRGTGRSGRDDWPGNGAAQVHLEEPGVLADAVSHLIRVVGGRV